MSNKKFNFAFVISIIILLIYSYIVFMGIVYWKDGDIALGILYSAALIVVTLACIIIMCRAKATRWKKIGKLGQIVCGIGILVALALSTMPFAHFIKLVVKQKEISASFEKAHEYGSQSVIAYDNYVKEREVKTRDFLNAVDAGHGESNPSEYAAIFGLPGNDSNTAKIDRMINSLHKILLPDSVTCANDEALHNLKKGAKMSVWNIAMPQYINSIDQMVKTNVETFNKLSKNAHGYRGDNNYPPFTYQKYTDQNAQLKEMLTHMTMPSIISILAALLCFAFMLLPYYLVERDLAQGTSGSDKRSPLVTSPSTRPNGTERRSRLHEREQRINQ